MHAFPVFNDTAGIKCTNSKTEIQSEIVETQFIGIKIDVVLKLEFLLFLVANLFVRSSLT